MLDLEALKAAVPLHEAVSLYAHTELQDLGRGKWKGLCAFHAEKTPSMHVNDEEGYFHCFGCGEGGDLVSFVQKVLSVDFVDAVTTLAEDYSIEVGTPGADDTTPDSVVRAQILAANRAAESAYAQALLDKDNHATAAAYAMMRSKKLTHAVAKEYGIGYAPGGQWLYNQLKNDFTIDILVKADLVRRSNSGSIRDRFHNRLTFSVRDQRGRVTGFNCRKLDEASDGGKYINTAATPVYNKSLSLFGIDQAKPAIRTSGSVIIVEGPTDVLAVASAGVKNAVASCGTAFGTSHLQVVRHLLHDQQLTVVMVFDGDSAGITAMHSSWQRLKTSTAILKGVVLPEDSDPNDLWVAGNADALASIEQRAQPLVQLLIDRALSTTRSPNSTPEDVSTATKQACELLEGWSDQVAATHYRSYIASEVGVPVGSLPDTAPAVRTPTESPIRPNDSGLAREALRLIAQSSEAASILAAVPATVWPSQHDRDIAHYLVSLRREYPHLPLHQAIDNGHGFPHRSDCFRLLMEPTKQSPQVSISDYATGVATMLARHAQTHTAAAQLAEVHQASSPEAQRAALLRLLSTRQSHEE